MPADDALWVDGQWRWRGGEWQWQPGDWARPRPGFYAPPKLERHRNGELHWYEGRWVAEPADE
jgi:hypothetical protein